MAEVNKYGKIFLCMKDIGKIIKQMEEVVLSIQMVMYMKGNGKMIKPMVKEYIITMMAQVIMDNGLKMFNKDLVFKNGQTDLRIKGIYYNNLVNIIMDLNMVLENLYGLIGLNMKVNSIKIKYKEEVKWYGLIKNSMKDNGKIIKCMVKVHLNGLMGEYIQATIMKIKNMDLV
jgi:hypothetical protein